MFHQLDRHFGKLTDVRAVRDPWGIGFTIGILRADHPDWDKWLTSNQKDDPIARTMTEVNLTLATEKQQAIEVELQDRPGFRRRRLTKQRRKQLLQETVTPQEVIRRTMREIPTGDLLKLGDEDLNLKKPGIAQILMRPLSEGGACWSGVQDDRTGEPAADTLENRLRFLGYIGVLVECAHGASLCFTVEEFQTIPPATELGKALASGEATAIELDGKPASEYWVDEEKPYGGQSAGDAITAWLLDESEVTAEYSSAREEEAADFLPATSAGGTVTGSP